MKNLFVFLLLLVTILMGCGETSEKSDDPGDGDADSDSDGDADGDADSDGDGDDGNHGGPETLEEDQDHQHHQTGGQQQRLCIARAIAIRPEIILMDEPASALDPVATLKIEDLMHELAEDYTIIIVTHNMQQAARVSEQTGLFWLGELVEFSSTEQMFTVPEKKLTEDYITGRMG